MVIMNKTLIICALIGGTILLSQPADAQQSREFNDYVVHYNALRTDLLPPQVAQGYGIQRSSSRALVNITVMKKGGGGDETAVSAKIIVNATNLTGQRREITMREIDDAVGAIYYVGELPVHNLETYQFKVNILPEGESEPLLVEFRQQFYTE
jgi:hypothetical protein